MKIKTGIDVIEVSRVKENIENYGDKFVKRVFTDNEIEYCEGKKTHKFESYAARFAAKEAVFKAISEFLDNKFNIDWKDIEVMNDKTGRPYINVDCMKNIDKNVKIDISISHIKDIAIASVVVYQQ